MFLVNGVQRGPNLPLIEDDDDDDDKYFSQLLYPGVEISSGDGKVVLEISY